MQRRATLVRSAGGAVAAASPRSTAAAVRVLTDGGSAADAAIAAHLVLAVDSPHATGFGGDLLALVRTSGTTTAYSGTGRWASAEPADPAAPGATITVPGFVAACLDLHAAAGRLPWERLFDEAIGTAEDGIPVGPALAGAVDRQRGRLEATAPASPLLGLAIGETWRQPELAGLLADLRDRGVDAWGAVAETIAERVQATGGSMTTDDLDEHRTVIGPPLAVDTAGGRLHVQPPPSQGVLLALAAEWVARHPRLVDTDELDHLLVEVTKAAFEHRDDAALGSSLLDRELDVRLDQASRRTGPRPYLHTAGVAVVDADGDVVSSLSSVFDDFGSAVHVPELGILLNNRAEGFTAGRNARRPGARPVHTLAPALLETPTGALGIATPGADGQVQTLLAVLTRLALGEPLADAVSAPRWRSQSGELLVEGSLERDRRAQLVDRGHDLVDRPDGIDAFGAVVAAGWEDGSGYAVADWRRQTTGGAV